MALSPRLGAAWGAQAKFPAPHTPRQCMLCCLLPSPDTSHPLTKLMANIPMVAVAKTAHCSVAQSFQKQPRTQAHL